MTDSVDSTARYPLIQVEIPSNVNFRDNVATFATQMSLIHNVIIRGLNSLYTKAPRVAEADTVDFAGYALAWTHLLHDHHHGEETILFPFLQTKLDMDHNINQHKEFIEPMKAFEDYMGEVQKKQVAYDGQKAREMLESFGDVLVTHLHEEVSTDAQVYLEHTHVSLDPYHRARTSIAVRPGRIQRSYQKFVVNPFWLHT